MAPLENSNVRIEIAESSRREAATADAPVARIEPRQQGADWPAESPRPSRSAESTTRGTARGPARRIMTEMQSAGFAGGALACPGGGESAVPTGSFRAEVPPASWARPRRAARVAVLAAGPAPANDGHDPCLASERVRADVLT